MELKEKLINTGYFIDNDYLDKYIDLINKNINNKKQKYYERHHILQRKYFNLKGIDVDNSDDNCVYLDYKDHILSHYYLSFCTKDELKSANEYCFIIMTFYKSKLTDDEKLLYKELDNYQMLYESFIDRIIEILVNREQHEWSEESRQKISKMFKGKQKSESHKLNLRKSRDNHSTTKNKKSIYNKSLNKVKFVNIEDLDSYLSTGNWILGGKPLSEESRLKISNSNKISLKGKKSKGLNKGLESKRVRCIDTNMIFDGIKEASDWMLSKGYSGNHIRDCCDGVREHTFNLHWEWLKD